MKKRTALISVFTKDQKLVTFARELIELGFKIISSGGTAKFLKENDIEVTDVATVTGFPPVLGHKVVTLAPQIHGGLLASEDQLDELASLGWPKIDLLYVTFYPLREELNHPGSTLESCLTKCDIGGPTMVRSAVKGGEVIVMTSPNQENGVIRWITEGEPDRRAVLDALRGKAEREVAEYVRISAGMHSTFSKLGAAQEYGL